MSMTDAISAVREIQATLTQLNVGASPDPATAATSVAFAQTLATTASPASFSASALSASALPTGKAIAEDAKNYVGVPYLWGGTDPKTGLDCSGLVQLVYKDLGITLPRVAVDQGNAGTAIPNLAAAKPGDLLVMNGGAHIGIYMGNNQYIHAPAPGQNVRIENIPAGAVFDKIARIIPDAPTVSSLPAGTDLLSILQASLATGRAA